MQKKIWFVINLALLFVVPVHGKTEFVKESKPKLKKETASQVKEDIVELLESSLRQLGQNIKQSADVQNKMFDTIKEMLTENESSTTQLKDLRSRLEFYLKNLEQQQADLYDMVLSCKLISA